MITAKPKNTQQLVRLGPWRGVRDVGDAGQQDPRYLQDAINCYFPDPQNGGAVVARPGFVRAGTFATTSEITNALIPYFDVANITPQLFAIANEKVYRQTASSGATSWTDVTPGVASGMGKTEPFYTALFNGEIIIASEVRPWRASDLATTPITGTSIQVNTAGDTWQVRGAPTVYGGKLFFIVQSIASTKYTTRIVWSEELDAATGYLQNGYTNSWDMIQTSSEAIVALVGTNAGLYVFRPRSIGVIYGAVSSDFSTASTHDGVSQEMGIYTADLGRYTAPQPLLAAGYIWFINDAGLPCRFRVGSNEIEPIWKQMRRRCRERMTATATSTPIVIMSPMAYSPDLGKVFMLLYRDASLATGSRHLYVFDAVTGNYEGQWVIELASQPANETPTAVVAEYLASGVANSTDTRGLFPTLLVAGFADSATTTKRVFVQTHTPAATFGDNSAAMHMSATTHLAPDEMVTDFHVDEAVVEAGPDSETLSLDYYTPRGGPTTRTATGLTGSDSIQSSHDHGIFRYGLLAMGRWVRFVFHWNVPSGSTPYFFERAVLKVRGAKATGTTK